MKLRINFDLLSKITASKTGFELDRTMKRVVTNTLIIETVTLPLQVAACYTKEEFIAYLLRIISAQAAVLGSIDIIFSKMCKQTAIEQLKILVYILKLLDINTDYDLLLESYKYHTDYKLEFNNSKLPKVKQEKYIMIPVYEDGEEKEVSILQEHIIGSKDYELSIGQSTPQKRLKLATKTI